LVSFLENIENGCQQANPLSNGELYTILTNNTAKGKKGAIVARIAGTKAQTVIAIIEKTPLKLRNTVSDITLDGSKHGIDCLMFPNKSCVTDTFTPVFLIFNFEFAIMLAKFKN
jgi:hypothetical protein